MSLALRTNNVHIHANCLGQKAKIMTPECVTGTDFTNTQKRFVPVIFFSALTGSEGQWNALAGWFAAKIERQAGRKYGNRISHCCSVGKRKCERNSSSSILSGWPDRSSSK